MIRRLILLVLVCAAISSAVWDIFPVPEGIGETTKFGGVKASYKNDYWKADFMEGSYAMRFFFYAFELSFTGPNYVYYKQTSDYDLYDRGVINTFTDFEVGLRKTFAQSISVYADYQWGLGRSSLGYGSGINMGVQYASPIEDIAYWAAEVHYGNKFKQNHDLGDFDPGSIIGVRGEIDLSILSPFIVFATMGFDVRISADEWTYDNPIYSQEYGGYVVKTSEGAGDVMFSLGFGPALNFSRAFAIDAEYQIFFGDLKKNLDSKISLFLKIQN
ncbi:MAG: hypothetical protein HUK20_06355 [Fibrobacter sp.]|nr:hypothetical protein [Fibrobacter sp.]